MLTATPRSLAIHMSEIAPPALVSAVYLFQATTYIKIEFYRVNNDFTYVMSLVSQPVVD